MQMAVAGGIAAAIVLVVIVVLVIRRKMGSRPVPHQLKPGQKCDAGVDVVLDMVAGPYMQKNIDVLARDGRYVIIAFLGGPSAELNLRAVLGKRLTITGSTLRPQSVAEKAEIAQQLERKLLPMLASGTVRPIIFREFPLAEASDAHALMQSSEHMGKIVLTLD